MVFFNYATMQMAAKIVYYGPGLCGKTTNLHHIYSKTSPQGRGEMVSLETETDRTLFFDLLPLEVGVIGGFKTRLQLYTVPGQVFYNTTRKLVLKGADGIVFVADSQRAMADANVESLKNLRENLKEIGLNLDEMPMVIQLNKRDLPNAMPPAEILRLLDPDARWDSVEAVAVKGEGVFETLKTVSKLTLRTIRQRMAGDDTARPAAPPAAGRAVLKVISESSQARPQEVSPARTISVPNPLASPPPQETSPAGAATPHEAKPAADEPPMHLVENEAASHAESATATMEAARPEPDVDFAHEEKEPAAKESDVKHVRVRSSVDIMAELEQLRKKATQAAPRSRRGEVDLDSLMHPRREVHKSFPVQAAPGTRTVRVSVAFEDQNGETIGQDESSWAVDSSEVETLLVNLKANLGSDS